MAASSMKKVGGRKSTKVREQATYKDKLQGSQLTLEKLLRNTKNTHKHGKSLNWIPSFVKSK